MMQQCLDASLYESLSADWSLSRSVILMVSPLRNKISYHDPPPYPSENAIIKAGQGNTCPLIPLKIVSSSTSSSSFSFIFFLIYSYSISFHFLHFLRLFLSFSTSSPYLPLLYLVCPFDAFEDCFLIHFLLLFLLHLFPHLFLFFFLSLPSLPQVVPFFLYFLTLSSTSLSSLSI